MEKYTIMLLLLIGPLTQAGVYRWVDDNGKVHYGDKPPEVQEVEILDLPTAPTEGVRETPGDPGGSASTPAPKYTKPKASERLRIRKMLEHRQFRELNDLLEDRLQAFRRDVDAEWELLSAYWAFDLNKPAWQDLFDRWVEQYPSYYQPYVARAQYYDSLAWQARGKKYAQETPEENLAEMRALLALAQADLREALRLQRYSLTAYYTQISIFRTLGDREGSRAAMRTGLEIYPYSYHLRQAYMNQLEPRWGGSFQQMQDYAAGAQQYVEQNPRLASLLVDAHEEMMRYLYRDDRYQDVVELASEIIDFRASGKAYYYRGRSYFWLKEYANAREDFSAAIRLAPDAADYYYWRARAHRLLKQGSASFRDINRAHALDPESDKIARLRQKLLARLRIRQIPSVKPDPHRGSLWMEPDPDDPEALFNYAKTQVLHKQYDDAVASLDRAIDINPGEIRYYQFVADLLLKLDRLDEAPGYWGRYLLHQPEDGNGYFERAGTLYHLQDIDASLVDLNKALALGVDNMDKARRYRDELQLLVQ